jgi:hypothetical protein
MLSRQWKSTIISSIVFIVLNQGASVVVFVSSHNTNILINLVFPEEIEFLISSAVFEDGFKKKNQS